MNGGQSGYLYNINDHLNKAWESQFLFSLVLKII